MSRVLKVQAWHKTEKKIFDVIGIDLDAEFGGVWRWGKVYHDPDTGEQEADKDFVPFTDVDLRFFTSRKDKNDKEIYEGDILGLEDPEDHSRALVIFELGAFKVKLIGILHTPVYDAYWDDWIIIGNIHENSELIGKEV